MAAFNVASGQCPLCSVRAVSPIRGARGYNKPLYRCSQCGAELRSGFTPEVLWAVPIVALSLFLVVLVVEQIPSSATLVRIVVASVLGSVACAGAITVA